ncbi:SH3 domain-containing protein [Allorhizobium sp. BGMRC 0089]|uniref:SH3 domain-containing protein n=1 Tax=Allorhizobium sonneratiae TaxID=2934936 RepID=UPI00203379D5|nr:SH3 domain-containing protein [Allorhizobium sonneratiae]MCM2294731.1 SH3 domain-containing protein [Allorhizobium sonneratiae]
MKPMLVIKPHERSYADPIACFQGDRLVLTGREDIWEGHRWLWAIAEDGRQGWIPDRLVRIEADHAIALDTYSAMELSCEQDEILYGVSALHGWVWCRNLAGEEGWVPSRNLSEGGLA